MEFPVESTWYASVFCMFVFSYEDGAFTSTVSLHELYISILNKLHIDLYELHIDILILHQNLFFESL